MFTTDTPAAQLFSIPSSAARPPKLAPYPTLVGTAMTGTLHEPADDARQRPFHARDDHHHARRRKARMFAEQPVDAGNADVEEAIDRISHHLRRHACFFGHRQVRRARGGDENRAAAGQDIPLTVRDRAGDRLKCRAGNLGVDGGEGILVRPSDEQCMSARDNLRRDRGDLFGRLA